jgi:tyrosinase
MPTRRNLLRMTSGEQRTFLSALNAMKADGTYDEFTRRHHMNMMERTSGSGTYYSSTRNRGHRGPAFCPWHRWSLLDFEAQLIAHGCPFLPYWAWERESGSWSGTRTGIWAVVGGSGTVTAPFVDWYALLWNSSRRTFVRRSTPGIRRALGSASGVRLPSQADVDSVMAYTSYDAGPCDDTSRTVSFRNAVEGWLRRPGQDHSMHNAVHRFVGGDLLAATSPNDLLFWLNHANVDRLWWQWQQRHGLTNYPGTSSGFPAGHARTSTLRHLAATGRTNGGALDSRALGVDYEAP